MDPTRRRPDPDKAATMTETVEGQVPLPLFDGGDDADAVDAADTVTLCAPTVADAVDYLRSHGFVVHYPGTRCAVSIEVGDGAGGFRPARVVDGDRVGFVNTDAAARQYDALPPVARNTDPPTSKRAAERAERSRQIRRGSIAYLVLRAYAGPGRGGLTAREAETVLAETPGFHAALETARKRVSDLHALGYLEVVTRTMLDANGYTIGTTDLERDGGRVLCISDKGRDELDRIEAQ